MQSINGERQSTKWGGDLERPSKQFSLWRTVFSTALTLMLFCTSAQAQQKGVVSDSLLIKSEILGYTQQYWVYTPPGYESGEEFPVLFLADGAWYLEPGGLPNVLDTLIGSGEVEPVIAVFLDARVPGYPHLNRRNGQFFCNKKYIQFYQEEFIPAVEKAFKTQADRSGRTIAGLSFGGLNAACFGLFAHESFAGIAMQSPATHPVRYLHQAYQDSTRLPLNIFLSSGDHKDNESRTRAFRDILQAKQYPMKYIEVPFAHNWDNWKPLLDDMLLYFYGTSSDLD